MSIRAITADVSHGLRLLRKSPAFTIVATITLALGIGANTAIYTLLTQALLRSLPVEGPDRLVLLHSSGSDTGYSNCEIDDQMCFSYPMYRDLRDQNSVFDGIIANRSAQVGVQWHNQPELADAELVSGNYFDVLGVQPALGRLFVAADDMAQEANPVAALSFSYWQRRFGSDPRILNQSISINGHPFTVVGIAPPDFHSLTAGKTPAIFVPTLMKAEITPGWNDLEERRSKWLNIVGRLKTGLTREQAQAGIDPLWHSIRADELQKMGHRSQRFQDGFLTNSHLFLEDGSKGVATPGSRPTTLLIVMGLAGLMALMSSANVAALLLVRMASRTREISVRYALGAQRRRVVQQLLAEGIALGLAGGALGIVLAPEISALLIKTMFADRSFSAHPNLQVLAFNFCLALFVSLFFSLAPIVQFWRPDVSQALKQQATSIANGSIHLRRASVAAQIGLSLILLVGAGLFVRTLHNLRSLDVGFATDHLVTFSVDPRFAGYQAEQTTPLLHRTIEQLAALPGVQAVGATNDPDLANTNTSTNITVSGYHPAENEDMNVEWSGVSSGYFSTLKMPILAGRTFTDQDRSETQKLAVVNESFARRYFNRPQDAVGQYLCKGAGNVTPDIQIIGVVKDAKHTCLRCGVHRSVFTPFLRERLSTNAMTFYARTWQAPENAEGSIRQAMLALDSKLVLDRFRTMQEQVDQNLTDEQVIATLALCFGALASLIAAIGIYGVLAYSTAQRTREIGLRMAMGATRTEVFRLVLTEVVRLAAIGLTMGLPLAFILARTVRDHLFGVSAFDPITLLVVCSAIGGIAVASAALPAMRAAKVDPMVALRYE
jgi:putative ABC transport system permease protein